MAQVNETFDIRIATADDGDALADVFENSPDGGAIGFAPRFRSDPYEAYTTIRRDVTGFIAETDSGEPAGAGFVSLTRARFGGEVRDCAILDGLAVREAYRGQGLGKRLAAERVAYAEEQLGEGCVVLTYIQEGNEPSKAVAESWADQFAYDQVISTLEPLDDPATNEYEIRNLRDAEGPEAEISTVVERSNEFYADAELYAPLEPDSLERRLTESPLGDPVFRYLVAYDGDEIVAGTFVLDQHKLMWVAVDELPSELENSDELPASIPESREIRMSVIGTVWYDEGHEAAGEALIEAIRADAGEANRIVLQCDRDGPVGSIVDNDEALIHHRAAIRGLPEPESDRFTAFTL